MSPRCRQGGGNPSLSPPAKFTEIQQSAETWWRGTRRRRSLVHLRNFHNNNLGLYIPIAHNTNEPIKLKDKKWIFFSSSQWLRWAFVQCLFCWRGEHPPLLPLCLKDSGKGSNNVAYVLACLLARTICLELTISEISKEILSTMVGHIKTEVLPTPSDFDVLQIITRHIIQWYHDLTTFPKFSEPIKVDLWIEPAFQPWRGPYHL
jgi:hypothetical protein